MGRESSVLTDIALLIVELPQSRAHLPLEVAADVVLDLVAKQLDDVVMGCITIIEAHFVNLCVEPQQRRR